MFLNSETIRGEGVWHFVDGLSFTEKLITESHDIETCFAGPGSRSKAAAAMRRIEKIKHEKDESC
jgi:hypothetical protein